jgi:hypothetical protein
MTDQTEIRALSLSRPWPWIILTDLVDAAKGKRVENRSRNIGNYRGWVFMHAAGSEDFRAREIVEELLGADVARLMPPMPEHVTGIVGLMLIVDVVRPDQDGRLVYPDRNWRWRYEGSFAYVLAPRVIRLAKHYPYPGALGFWRVPEAVRAEVARDPSIAGDGAIVQAVRFTEAARCAAEG